MEGWNTGSQEPAASGAKHSMSRAAAGIVVSGFVDDRTAGAMVRGLPVIAPDDMPETAFVVAIGDPVARLQLARTVGSPGS